MVADILCMCLDVPYAYMLLSSNFVDFCHTFSCSLSTSSVSLPSVAAASLGGALKPQLNFKHYLKSLYSVRNNTHIMQLCVCCNNSKFIIFSPYLVGLCGWYGDPRMLLFTLEKYQCSCWCRYSCCRNCSRSELYRCAFLYDVM